MGMILEIRSKPNFPQLFQFLTVEAVFLGSGNRFFIECFILASENGFLSSVLLFRVNFVLVETIEVIFIEKLFSYYWKPFSTFIF